MTERKGIAANVEGGVGETPSAAGTPPFNMTERVSVAAELAERFTESDVAYLRMPGFARRLDPLTDAERDLIVAALRVAYFDKRDCEWSDQLLVLSQREMDSYRLAFRAALARCEKERG